MKHQGKITIIGSGNIASHLSEAIHTAGFELLIYGRNKKEVNRLSDLLGIGTCEEITDIDPESLVIICVTDQEIEQVLNLIPQSVSVVYTSGTIALDSLKKRENLGVFYPLQSFTKGRKIDFSEVPILIEASNPVFSVKLVDLAQNISKHVEYADSKKRKHIHLAAVFVNNFPNHLFHLAKNHLNQQQIEWELLFPLIQETFRKIEGTSPFDAQTGPARRADLQILRSQEMMLEGKMKSIYQVISESIDETYHPRKK